MTKARDIENLRFEFGDAWRKVCFYDDEEDLKAIKHLDESKDVDIIGIHDNGHLYLIEVTDLRGHRIENKEKLKNGEMAKEFAQKVRNTIPALIGAFHATPHKEQWVPFTKKLADRSLRIRVILWMEQDRYPARKHEKSTLIRQIENQLKWLKPKVMVESLDTHNKENLDINVINLPRTKGEY